jgi:hypothetical protein
MEQKLLIENLNNAVRLVYLTYDYAGANPDTPPERIKSLETEIVDHCNQILKTFKQPVVPFPSEPLTAKATPTPQSADLSWLDTIGKTATDEELASMARGG